MSAKYRDKKGSTCGMCKPHKRGWEDKHNFKYRQIMNCSDDEIKYYQELGNYQKESIEILTK